MSEGEDSESDNSETTGEYDNPFIEDPRHNALFTLDRYQGNINALKDRFAEPGYFKLESVQELTATTGEVNVGLGQCRQYVTRIGELGDGLSGTIKVIWNAIPAIRMAIGGDDDLAKVKDWEGQIHKIHIPVDERASVEERAKIKQLVADLLRQSVDILKIADKLGDESTTVAKKLRKINLEIGETEKKLAEEQRRAEEIERKKREKEEEEKRKEEEERKKKEEEERKRLEEEERKRKEEEDRKRKVEEERLRREEEEHRRKEETRRKREEEKKRREEELRKQREWEEKRKNPNNWPELRYEVERMTDYFQKGLGCIVRDADATLQKEQLECCVVPIRKLDFDFGSQEECISNVISLKSRDDDVIQFGELPAQISIPCMDARGRHRQPQVYMKDGGAWKRVQTTSVPDDDAGTGVNLAHFSVPSIKNLTFFVAMVTVTSTKEFNKEGGKLQAANDSKVTVNVMRNTFRKPGAIGLRVIPKDTVNQARERVKDADGQLLDASSMVYVTINGEPTKPVQIEINFPQGEGTGTGRVRPASSSHVIHVMTSSDGHHWIRNNPTDHRPNDTFVVQVDPTINTVLLLKTKDSIQPPVAQSLARDIDDKLRQTAANLVVRQNDKDPSRLFVQCCAREKTDAVLDRLNTHGYTTGPMPGKEFYIKEGSGLTLTFRSNIDFDEHAPRPLNLTFTASLETAKFEGFVKVVDEYKQRDRDDYVGVLQLWADNLGNDKQSKAGLLLDEFQVTLPKNFKRLERTKTGIYYGTAPLTRDYMFEVAHELGDEWQQLASCLGLERNTVQQIIQRNAMDPGDDWQNVKFDMLRTWHMKTTKGSSQVDQLINSYRQVRRHDLAAELDHRNQEIMQEKREIARKQMYMEAAKAISQDSAAVAGWRPILNDLGTDSGEVSDIEGRYGSVGNRKCLQEGIMAWEDRMGPKADMKKLTNVLIRLGHKIAADKISHFLRR